MAMRFPYLPLPTKQPIPSLGGAMTRHRPIVPIRVIGGSGSRLVDGCIDSACDDTIFPKRVADLVGIDLANAAKGEAKTAAGSAFPYSYARVALRITDGIEECEWEATVGFVDLRLRWALLGHAGFLDFFDTELRGVDREAVNMPNAKFSGTRVFRQLSSP